MNNLCLHDFDILKKFFNRLGIKQIIYHRKRWFLIFSDDLMWPLTMFEVILHFIKKKVRLHNVIIHRNFYQNRFIKECSRRKKAKIPMFHSLPVSEFFFLRYRRTYVLNNVLIMLQQLFNILGGTNNIFVGLYINLLFAFIVL